MSDQDQNPNPDPDPDPNQEDDKPQSRFNLIWNVLVFQLKLTVDGLRDVILVPVSFVAALLGLLAGGREPAKYFDAVIRFGRKTEIWINLFGHHKAEGTSDDLVAPLQRRVMAEAQANPLLRKAGDSLNRSLDRVEQAIGRSEDSQTSEPPDGPTSEKPTEPKNSTSG